MSRPYSILRFVLRSTPCCGRAPFSAGWFKTQADCPACGARLEREAGFYAGAIYAAYFLFGLTGALISLALMAFLGMDWTPAFFLGCLGILAAAQPIFIWSRLAFLYGNHRFFSGYGGEKD